MANPSSQLTGIRTLLYELAARNIGKSRNISNITNIPYAELVWASNTYHFYLFEEMKLADSKSSCVCLGFVLKRTYFAHLLGNLFEHLVLISNEGANLFGRGSVQNECQTQAPPTTGLQQKRVYTSLGSSCPTCVHQSPWQSRENTHYNDLVVVCSCWQGQFADILLNFGVRIGDLFCCKLVQRQWAAMIRLFPHFLCYLQHSFTNPPP